jgi:hypothetical protein
MWSSRPMRVPSLIARCVITVAVLGLPAAVSAQTAYTNQGAWQAAVGSTTTLDFAGMAAPGFFATAPNPYNGVLFNARVDAVDPGYGPIYYQWGTGAVGFVWSSDWTMTFAAGTRAVGLSFGAAVPGLFSFTLNGGPTYGAYASGTRPNWAFFGLTSGSDVTTLEVNYSGAYYGGVAVYDNIMYSSAVPSTVPEPSTMGLLATGLVSVAGAGLKRRKR